MWVGRVGRGIRGTLGGGAEGREGKIRLAMHSGTEEKYNFFNVRVAGDDQFSSHACILHLTSYVSVGI